MIGCWRKIFTEAEIKILEDHGKRLERLADGRQLPANEAGRCFVEAINGTRKAETVYEKTWLKYQKRLELELDPVHCAAMGPPRKMCDDRKDWKRRNSANGERWHVGPETWTTDTVVALTPSAIPDVV